MPRSQRRTGGAVGLTPGSTRRPVVHVRSERSGRRSPPVPGRARRPGPVRTGVVHRRPPVGPASR
ncbi:hypothetical protein F750_5464 [Streptomyces sp. PAMC 26508]|nr:hypothetical protein F750_5464 [Streptomyces sp. PAMC 26508]